MKKFFKKENRGITLVALVITIIVLIILATVTISITIREGGIFKTAQTTVEQQKIAKYKEQIELSRLTVGTENMGVVTIEKLVEQLYKDSIVPEGSITIIEGYAVMKTPEGYAFVITTNSVEYVPGGEIKDPSSAEEQLNKGNIIITTNPAQGTYTNEKVTVTITSNVEGEKVQYSLDGGTTYKDYTEEFEVYENKTIYILLRNAIAVQGIPMTYEITNIDQEAPRIESVNTTPTSIIFTATDNASGIVGYKVTQNTTKPTEFDVIGNTKSLENKEVTVANQNTTYYVWVKDSAGNVSAYTTATTKQAVTDISIVPTSAILYTKDTKTLAATVNPANAYNKEITWESSNTDVATVDSNGTIIAVAAGTTIITATAKDGSGVVSNSCEITVEEIILGLSSYSGKILNGNGKSITVDITGQNYGDLTVTSSDENIATASISGTTLTITGTIASGTGNANITITGKNNCSAIYNVTAHAHSNSCYGTCPGKWHWYPNGASNGGTCWGCDKKMTSDDPAYYRTCDYHGHYSWPWCTDCAKKYEGSTCGWNVLTCEYRKY